MTFERPDLLWTVPAALGVLAVAFLSHVLRRRRVGRAFGGFGPARRLTGVDLGRVPVVRYALVALGVTAVSLAGTGPRRPDPPRMEPARPVSAVVAVDFSRSMGVDDVQPSRIGRAKAVTKAILEVLPSDRVGLVTFANQSYVLAPPTVDHDVVRYFIEPLESTLLLDADQGTRSIEALRAAGDLLQRYASDESHRIIVLISDGESHEEEARVMSQVAALREAGVRVFTVGVGTEEGAALMRSDYRGNVTTPFVGPDGEPVITALRPDFLRRVADEGNGRYLEGADASGDGPAMELLDDLGREPPDRRQDLADRQWDIPYALGLIALVLLVAESAGEAVVRRRREARRGRSR